MIAALIAGAAAYATIPDPSGVIHGCLKNGNLLIIDPSAGGACKSSETPLDWNQQGRAGPPGQPGAQGLPGKNGTGVLTFHISPDSTNAPSGIGPLTDALTFGPFVIRVNCNNNQGGQVIGTISLHSSDPTAWLVDRWGPRQLISLKPNANTDDGYGNVLLDGASFTPGESGSNAVEMIIGLDSPATGYAATAQIDAIIDPTTSRCDFFGSVTPD